MSNVQTSSSTIIKTQIVGPAYLGTPQGICKIIEIVASFIAVMLVTIHFYGWVIDMFAAAASISIIMGLLFLILYLSTTVIKMGWSLNRFQFIFHLIWAVFYLAANIVVLHHGSHFSRIIGGAVLGLIATLAHLADAVFNYKTHPLF